MPVPRFGLVSAGRPGGRVPPGVPLDGLTELRVHGVGGTPPEALLDDLAPQQVAGDKIAGFYRTAGSPITAGSHGQHVEGYSWGGLTSRSSWRVLWLLLLPFLLGNLAGWMCSERVRGTGGRSLRFRLHRASANLACLAMTVNLMLLTAMIAADVAGYQAARAGDANGRWWLKPLLWAHISGHPARQITLGMAVPVLFVVALAVLSSVSRSRYESVKPPVKLPSGTTKTAIPDHAPTIAAALPDGLRDTAFWDGEHSVRQAARRHVAAALAFLAITLAVTGRAAVTAAQGAPRDQAGWWAAVAGGGVAIALAGLRACLDFGHDKGDGSGRTVSLDRLSAVAALAIAILAGACSAIFAWLQPGVGAVPGQLPGMASVFDGTMIAVAAVLGLVLLASAAGGHRSGTVFLGPMVTMTVAFSLLNVTMFGAELAIAHLIGGITFTASAAAPGKGTIYIPELIGAGTPVLVLGALAAVFLFVAVEAAVYWRAGRGQNKQKVADHYQQLYNSQQAELEAVLGRRPRPGDPQFWDCSALAEVGPDGTEHPTTWAAGIARAERLGRITRDVGWLLWSLAVFQLIAILVVVAARPMLNPDGWLGKAAITLATLLPVLMVGLLRSGWSQPGRRRQIGMLWDVGTFWPRSYHPMAPPCYAERAVPDLQRRLWWIHDNGGRVVLAAHSQGSVLAAAALSQPDCLPDGDRTRLVTFGSPLGKLYSWAFPAYVSRATLAKIPQAGADRWRNVYYPTDPIGGRIFGPPEPAGGAAPAGDVDCEFDDPAGSRFEYGQPPPGPGRHSGYWTDPRVWEKVSEIARP